MKKYICAVLFILLANLEISGQIVHGDLGYTPPKFSYYGPTYSTPGSEDNYRVYCLSTNKEFDYTAGEGNKGDVVFFYPYNPGLDRMDIMFLFTDNTPEGSTYGIYSTDVIYSTAKSGYAFSENAGFIKFPDDVAESERIAPFIYDGVLVKGGILRNVEGGTHGVQVRTLTSSATAVYRPVDVFIIVGQPGELTNPSPEITNNPEYPDYPVHTYPTLTNRQTNYVVSVTPQKEFSSIEFNNQTGKLKVNGAESTNMSDALVDIQYYDGFGRPFELVERGRSASGKDLITIQEYDGLGRADRSWLPGVSAGSNGAYINPNTVMQNAASLNGGKPYSRPVYEAAPADRVIARYGPGSDWHDNEKAMRTDYLCNYGTSGELACMLYKVNFSNGVPVLAKNGYYADGSLHVLKGTDEDGNTAYTFTDKRGRTVLTRQVNGSELLDTYHVYDDFDNPCFVLPPLINGDISAANLDLYAYQYRYDHRNRCTWQKLPGCQPVTCVYDKGDNLIFSQDGNQRAKSPAEYTFYVYDRLKRLTVKGACVSPNISAVQSTVVFCTFTAANTGIGNSGYTSVPAITASALHLVNYYDTYDFRTLTGFNNSHFPAATVKATGLPTGSITCIPENGTRLYTAIYYDSRGREVNRVLSNHLAGYEKSAVSYNFTGQPVTSQHVHSASGKATQTIACKYTYDHAGRMLELTHKLGAATEYSLVRNTYDEPGRIRTSVKHGRTDLTSTYTYNVRSWLKSITGTRFNETLYYNESLGGSAKCYNGNVSAMTWRSGTETVVRGYKFKYDPLSRLTEAMYGENTSLSAGVNRFTEKITRYDKHGNIKKLERYGKTSTTAYGLIDNLTLEHRGNQLKYVNDAATDPIYQGAFNFVNGSNSTGNEYIYDANGNLVQDFNKKLALVRYNAVNLPVTLQFSNGNTTNYLYDASGVKRRVTHQTAVAGVNVPMGSIVALTGTQVAHTVTTDYCGNVIYENGLLSKILTPEGYITMNGTTPVYHYFLRDHLGNNRVVAKQDGTVVQVNHYYPFGGMFGEGTATSNQPYKFGDKELDRMHGLDWYDFEARMQDAALGIFMTVDPMAEKYYGLSPYGYCGNNPMRYVDPTGKEIVIVGNEEYQKQIWEILQAIYNSGRAGAYLVSEAIKNEKSFVIVNMNSEYDEAVISENRGKNSSVMQFQIHKHYEKFDEEDGGVERTPVTSLAHELGHFLFPQSGNLLDEKGETTRVRAGEVIAVEWENRVRKDLGMDERKKYYGIDIYGKEVDSKFIVKNGLRYHRMRNKSTYGNNDFTVNNYGTPKSNKELRLNYSVRGEGISKYLISPTYNNQIRWRY